MQEHQIVKFDISEAQKKDKDIALVISWLQKKKLHGVRSINVVQNHTGYSMIDFRLKMTYIAETGLRRSRLQENKKKMCRK